MVVKGEITEEQIWGSKKSSVPVLEKSSGTEQQQITQSSSNSATLDKNSATLDKNSATASTEKAAETTTATTEEKKYFSVLA